MSRASIFATVRERARPGLFNDSGNLLALDNLLDAFGVPREGEGVAKPIDLIDVSILKVAAPERTAADLQHWVEPLKAVCRRYEIDTFWRIAAFITPLSHEGDFVVGEREDMNHSAARLAAVWPNLFKGPTLSS